MNEVSFNMATEADAVTLTNSRVAFLTEICGEQASDITEALREQLRTYFQNALADKSYVGVVATSDDKLVATGGMVFRAQPGSFKNPSGKTAYILNMYTVPDWRKQGISTRILNMLMDIAQDMGIQSFELHATTDGEPVYQKNGFHKHHEPTYRKHAS